MSNKQLIRFVFAAAFLCSCNSEQNATVSEPPAHQEQAIQQASDKPTSCGGTACNGDSNRPSGQESASAGNQPSTSENQGVITDNQPLNTEITEEGDAQNEDADAQSKENADHQPCGEIVCQYKEICKDNQCKTAFEMNVFLAPIPKEGVVKNDSYDYWECSSETCTYISDKTYMIPKGIRVREDTGYCGGEGLPLSKMKDYACTNKGWVCVSPDGCGKCDGECRYGECSEVTCSPGEKCRHGSGCEYASASIDNIVLCENGDCECGTQRCGKNQICAYGDCYFAGKKMNGFGDCEFTGHFSVVGTSDTPEYLVRYLCPKRCPSEMPPQNKAGYAYEQSTLQEYHGVSVGLWECQSKDGCECGDRKCPQYSSCIDGKCVLMNEEYCWDAICSGPDVASTCASDYVELLTYQPKAFELYDVEEVEYYSYKYWSCNAPDDCVCNGEKLPPNTICHGNSDGTEYVVGISKEFGLAFNLAPASIKNYIYKNDQWVCKNELCSCGSKPLPENANCRDEKIYCFHDIVPDAADGYVCNGIEKKWSCTSEKCLCGGMELPKNAHCSNEKIYCYGDRIPDAVDGYACSEKEKKWVCTSEKCLCGGMELRPGIRCKHEYESDYQICGHDSMYAKAAAKHDCIDSKWVIKKDYQCCGISCFSTQTASEYDCVDSEWVVKAEDGQRHCQNKLLPPGTVCDTTGGWDGYQEYAVCGEESLFDWADYRCENNHWTCALKDKPCTCNGKPLPEGSRCNNNEVCCGRYGLPVGYDNRLDELSCRDDMWWINAEINPSEDANKTESGLCFGHKLNEGVHCPSYDKHQYHFATDIVMSDMESCEHVRGCLCDNRLCPPSGICTEHGCIDPLTNKPFEAKADYLVSGKFRQCANEAGCTCGNSKIEYRDYCYNDEPYISMRSCVSNNKRTIAENNYLSYNCEYGDAPWQNDCAPDSDIDPTQYIMRDCLTANPSYFSDRSVQHNPLNVCIQKEGCQCIHNTCKYGEACYKGQCIADYPCHDLEYYDEDVTSIGKCRPSNPEG